MLKHQLQTLSELLSYDITENSPRNIDLFSSNTITTPKKHDVFRAEPNDGIALPNVIIPSDGDLDDLFANAATYYKERCPLSSLMYILGNETAGLVESMSDSLGVDDFSNSKIFRYSYLGSAIGEATIASLASPELNGIVSYAASKRTLAYLLCRSGVIYKSKLSPNIISSRWIRLRNQTGLTVSNFSVDALHVISSILGCESKVAINVNQLLLNFLREIVFSENKKFDTKVEIIIDLYPSIKDHLEDLVGPFDKRLAAFTKIVNAIRSDTKGALNDEIVVAYYLNLLLPGSFSHTGVLLKLIEFYPAALIWYGFFAALSSINNTSTIFNSTLMIKLERDLLERFSFEQRPNCDISFEELEVLSRGNFRAEVALPNHQKALLVGLVPGVNVYSRFGFESDSNIERHKQEYVSSEVNVTVTKLLEEALSHLKRLGVSNVKSGFSLEKKRQRKVK